MRTKKIIRQIAKAHGVTPKQVEEDMKIAIHESRYSSNPIAQELWKQLAPDGKDPTIEEFLRFCSERISVRNNYSRL